MEQSGGHTLVMTRHHLSLIPRSQCRSNRRRQVPKSTCHVNNIAPYRPAAADNLSFSRRTIYEVGTRGKDRSLNSAVV